MSSTLRTEHRVPLEHVTMGLGWDPARRSRGRADIDLNAAALLFTADRITDVVYHEQFNSHDGAVRLNGDSMTGEGAGDDEIIAVDLTRLPGEVTAVLFLVTCYTGQTFDRIANAFCRVVDTAAGTEIARCDLTAAGPYTGLVMGRMAREGGGWRFDLIGAGLHARHPVDAVPHLGRYLPGS